MPVARTLLLFVATACAEIVGCYLPYLWLRRGSSPWPLLPGALSLVAFAWLLSLHPTAAGRTYAAYGGVYVIMSLAWLWLVERIRCEKIVSAWRDDETNDQKPGDFQVELAAATRRKLARHPGLLKCISDGCDKKRADDCLELFIY